MKVEVLEFQRGKGLPKGTFERIAQGVGNGQLVVFPAETAYAVGGDAFNQKLVQKLRELRGDADKPLALYIGSMTELRLYAAPVVPRLRRAIERLLPGPTAVVARATQAAPRPCVSHTGSIEIHMPDSQSYQMFYEAGGRPLVGTSLTSADREEILRWVGDRVDLIIFTDEPLHREGFAVLDFTQDPPVALQGELPKWLQAGF